MVGNLGKTVAFEGDNITRSSLKVSGNTINSLPGHALGNPIDSSNELVSLGAPEYNTETVYKCVVVDDIIAAPSSASYIIIDSSTCNCTVKDSSGNVVAGTTIDESKPYVKKYTF